MRDNVDSSPDIIQARHKAGRRQFDLNVELTMSNKQSTSAGAISANIGATISGGSAGGGGGIILGGGGGGGDGISRCFGASTLISLPNGSSKAIARIEIGDYIQVPQPDGSIKPGKVISTHISVAKEWLEIATDTKPTVVKPRHLFRTNEGQWRMIQDLDVVVGMKDERWSTLLLIHKELVKGPERTFYTLGVDDPAHAYIADGYWVKNRKEDPDLDDFEV